MEKGTSSDLLVMFMVFLIFVIPRATIADPRSQIVGVTCTNRQLLNLTQYLSNLYPSMGSITTQIQRQGYGLANTGQGPNAYYALVQCYGDLNLTDCVMCYSLARNMISRCSTSTGAMIFLDGCFMRRGTTNFFHEYTGNEDKAKCGNRTRNFSAFKETVKKIVMQAVLDAPKNNGYARIEIPVSKDSNVSAYVLANCWRSLGANSCRLCLENASTSILGCLPRSEGRALNTGCYVRYSDTNFFNSAPSNRSSRGSPAAVIAAVISSIFVVAGAATIGGYIWNRRKIGRKRKGPYDAVKMAKALRDSSLNFKYSTLEKATGCFSEANKLGQGGFGIVYKGVLQDGREIAVKRLFFNSMHRLKEFYNEVNIISSIQHKNLVRLLGCSCSGQESLLVYEFLPNQSLDRFIFSSNKGNSLTWQKRFAIIIGIAEGLVYLHENSTTRIIHRDIKASNILLDTKLQAKIADFGLARSFQDDISDTTTVIAGTLGYIAPEYIYWGRLTEKVDVYSFGVLLLEIVAGRQNNGNEASDESFLGLVNTAWKHFQNGTINKLVDPNLMLHKYPDICIKFEARRVIHIALLCTQEIPSLRPSMSMALQMLARLEERLPPPTSPPFIDQRNMEFNGKVDDSLQPLNFAKSESVANVSLSILYPR